MSYLKNHRLLLLIISVLLIANIGLLYLYVFNKPAPPPRLTEQEMREKAKEKVRKEVGLNDEQLVIYDSLRNKQFERMRPLFEELTKSKENFFNQIYKNEAGDSAINRYAVVIGEKQQAVDISTYRYLQSIKELCNEEQRPKMDSFIQQIVKRICGGRRGPSPDKKDKK